MSTAAFDLGRRLRSAHEGRPVPNLTHAPALPPHEPVAVLATKNQSYQVRAATPSTHAEAEGPEALDALLQVGVGLTPAHRTLVIPDRATLDVLLEIALRCAWHPTLAGVAAAIAWWAGRAEHPGSSATLVLTETLRRRWTLGVPAEQDNDLSTWASWLKIDSVDTTRLLDLAHAVTSDALPFPGLQTMDGQDRSSWEWLLAHPTDWTRPDTRSGAALALTTRCDAADLFDSFHLDDPLAATRAVYSGEVVVGHVTDVDPIRLTADQPLSRLRAGTDVVGWAGEPWQSYQSGFSARIESAGVDDKGDLVLTLALLNQRQTVDVGTRLTVRRRRVDPYQQSAARRQRRIRHSATANWLATRACPPPARRDVPLDIAIAAATDD